MQTNLTEKMSTKEKILQVSINLFSQKGYSGVSVREITREVGIKESSLYNHFKNKEEILESIFSIFREEFSKLVPPFEFLDEIISKSTVEDFLLRGYENFRTHINHPVNEKFWRILYIEHYREPLAREIFLNDIIKGTIDFLESAFEKFIQLGKMKAYPTKLLASEYQYPLFSMHAEYNMLRFDGKDTSEIEQKMKDHIQFFLEHVTETKN
ncbi:TetR/AcrR family transcriptional regulator [Bacillus sp. 31A1R]|uniref:TetR/AcrR family transcriptional regulator n=1 Tax=Robertmurraya mangrovi TaxID=3098077 RepID=A0ABU5IWI4_9BACI|nr:TetR/AcrR family transcriptional regulator [Bacillus sp. 31A1R]MDZ5471512.1 TetR/AcrR family transcriptional regulator [Bacillus sp. 31A1R]